MIYLIIIFGLALRLFSLNQSLWLDETISALAARDYSFLGIITKFLPGDTHPPLYYLLLKAWGSIFGYSEISLRLPSVIFGVLTIYFVYKIGYQLKGKKLGLIAAALMATAPLHLYYSQEVRMYAMNAFSIVLLLNYYIVILKSTKPISWFKFGAAMLFVGLTDYLPLLVLPVLWWYAFRLKQTSAWWGKFILSHLPIMVFYLFWLPTLLMQMRGAAFTLPQFPAWGDLLGRASFKQLALIWVKFVTGRISILSTFYRLLAIGSASIVFFYTFFRAYLRKKSTIFIWVWLLIPIVLSFVAAIFSPGFSYFRFIFVLPAFYLLTAYGIESSKIEKALLLMVIFSNLAFCSTYLGRPQFWREDWRSAVSFIEQRLGPNEVVLMSFPQIFAPYQWYAKKPDVAYGIKPALNASSYAVSQNVAKITDSKNGVYSLDYLQDVTDTERVLFTELKNRGFNQKEVYNFQGTGQIRYWTRL